MNKHSYLSSFLLMLALAWSGQAHCQGQKNHKAFNPAKADTNYFLGFWQVYNYKIEDGNKKYFHYTDESNCCRGEGDKNCVRDADLVVIEREHEKDVLDLFWFCEKGGVNLKLKLPDTLLMDERIYTKDPYKWKARKITYINENEFMIRNWRDSGAVNHFTRTKDPRDGK